MANRFRGEVTVSLAGRAYTLRPSFHILCRLEERIGLPLPQLAQRVGEKGLLASEILMILAIATQHDGSRAFDSAVVMDMPAESVNLHDLMPDIGAFLLHALPLAEGGECLTYADLLETAYRVLRLAPEQFWQLTPPEFRLLLRAARQDAPQDTPLPPMAEVHDMARRFPDIAA